MKTKQFFTITAIIAFIFSAHPVYAYYPISPYVYCMNNPVNYVDPDGRDAMLAGAGTKEDPYVITANYYYKNGSLSEDQLKGLNSAISDYNNSGKKGVTEVKNEDGSKSYVRYNLSAQGVDDVGKAVTGDIFTEVDGQSISYGNSLGTTSKGDGSEFGSANGWHVNINPTSIAKGVSDGFNESKLTKNTFIHEIGHNLGLDHQDNTNIMDGVDSRTHKPTIGPIITIYSYPGMDKKGTQIIMNKVNTPRVSSLGIVRTK